MAKPRKGVDGYESKSEKRLITILFTLAGIFMGLVYYAYVGCATGSCAITSSPITIMAYMGFMGWLVSGLFGGGCAGDCSE